jgi:hypothetical protein
MFRGGVATFPWPRKFVCHDRAFRYFFVAVSLRLRYKVRDGPRKCYQHLRSPNQSTWIGGAMAVHKRTKKRAYQRVLKFPEAKGRIIASAELLVSSDYFTVEIKFQDKTSLSFDFESCVKVFPELINWKSSNYKPLRRWRPIHSRSSRVF